MSSRQGTVRPLRVKVTGGPVPVLPCGGWGAMGALAEMPGVMAGPAPNASVRICAWFEPEIYERGGDVVHEQRRPAQVGAGISRQIEVPQEFGIHPAAVGVVAPEPIGRQRCAVTDLGSGVRQLSEESACFVGEDMPCGIAGSVEPQDLPARPVCGQRGQNRQHRRGADSGGDQQDGVGTVL